MQFNAEGVSEIQPRFMQFNAEGVSEIQPRVVQPWVLSFLSRRNAESVGDCIALANSFRVLML